jgi:hypothetical protein
MKNFLKSLLKKNNLIFIAIFLLATLVRFYNFPDRVTFGPEQAISLETSAKMIKEKFSLLGIENVQRTTSQGLKIFSGALFSYSIIPLLLIFDYRVLPISVYFSVLNIFTGLVLYFVAEKMYGKKVATFSLVLFLFNNYMVYHSLFIWILNYLPLLGVFSIYLLNQEKRKFSLLPVFWLGILSGIGMTLEYLFLPTYLLVLILALYFSKKRFVSFVVFFFSSLIPNLPLIIFDLRHNFYNLNVLWLYFLDVLNHPGISGVSYYHFLQFWPFVILVLGLLAEKIWDKSKLLSISLIIVYLIINIRPSLILLDRPTGMPKDLTINNIYSVAATIKKDNPLNFNVAVINDFDTRGHILRYPLEFTYNLVSEAVENYPNAKVLYVLAQRNYDFKKSNVWEINSGGPYKIDLLSNVGQGYSIFKLSK